MIWAAGVEWETLTQLSVRVPARFRAALRQLAEARGMTMNAVVMDALERYAAQIVAEDPLTSVGDDVLRFVQSGDYAEHISEAHDPW